MSVCDEGVSCRTAPTTPSREIQRPHIWVLRSAAVQCSQVTSASPSEGKSTIAIHLAVAHAQQHQVHR